MPRYWRLAPLLGRFTPLLTVGLALPAQAGECLRGVDNMTVVYALAASPEFVSPQAPKAGQSAQTARLAEYETRSQERPVAPHAQPRASDFAEERQTLMPLPELSASVPHLSEAQRHNLQETLYAARDAEADGNEAKCEELLQKAKDIAAAPPASAQRSRPPKAPQR